MELVSIVVPVYNVKGYIDRCIESLVIQTYKKIEIILVDDGSTDGSGELCDKWKGLYPDKIKVIHKVNGGLSDARNTGIAYASGHYICFVDSDDYVSEKIIEIMVSDMKQHNVQMACVGFSMFYGETAEFYLEDGDITVFDKLEAIKQLFTTETFCNFAWNKLYVRSYFDDVKFPIGKKMEDLGTTYKLIEKCDRVSYNSSKLYFYYQRSDSILHTIDKLFYVDKFVLSMERYQYLKEKYGMFSENVENLIYTIFQCYYYIFDNVDLRTKAEVEMEYLWKTQRQFFSIKRKIKYFTLKHCRRLYCLLFGKRFS